MLGIIVDLDCLGQRLGVSAVTLTRHMTAFSAARHRKGGFTWTVTEEIQELFNSAFKEKYDLSSRLK